jgi:hypothetical protein
MVEGRSIRMNAARPEPSFAGTSMMATAAGFSVSSATIVSRVKEAHRAATRDRNSESKRKDKD